MKKALEWTRKENQKQSVQQTVVHYFFNARAPTSLEKSSLGLYRSLTYQLLCACPSVRSLFTTKFALKEPGDSDDAWTKEELQDFLGDVVASAASSDLCMFIDALDEGEQEEDVRQMISFLVDLSERALERDSSCRLQICLSSRHYPHISIEKGLSLVVEEQHEHGQDIDTYIRQKLIGSNGENKDELSAEIRHKSASIFLWVKDASWEDLEQIVLCPSLVNSVSRMVFHGANVHKRIEETLLVIRERAQAVANSELIGPLLLLFSAVNSRATDFIDSILLTGIVDYLEANWRTVFMLQSIMHWSQSKIFETFLKRIRNLPQGRIADLLAQSILSPGPGQIRIVQDPLAYMEG